MFFTLISFFLILFILFGFSRIFKNSLLKTKEYSLLNQTHTKIILGAATFLILMSHIANYYGFSFLIPIGGIGTVLFLIASGYGLNESFKSKGLTNFFKKRLLRLMIPYWIMVVFYWCIHFKEFDFYQFTGSLILLNKLPFMWFIYFIMLWYVIFFICKKFLNEKIGTIVMLIIGITFIFIFKDTTQGEKALAFPVGVLLSQYEYIKQKLVSRKFQKMLISFSVGFVFSVLFFLLKIKGYDTIDNYLMMNIVQILMKVSLSVLIIQFTFHFRNYIYGGLFVVGSYAYEVYLSHTLIIKMLEYNPYLNFLFLLLVILIAFTMKKYSNKMYNTVNKQFSVSN